ncbi:MAG: ABC transporter permease, partial [Chloroflexi bacterium]|nr:ABC transporter permease [Chloroflexota bacterium]
PVFSYAGLLPWVFLSNSLSFAVPSLVNNMNLVTKVYFPREILPIGNVGAALVDFGLSAAVFVVMMLFYRVSFTWALIWIPVLLVIQSLLVLGVVLFLAAVNVFYRDIRFVIPMLTQVWMYATP